MATIEPTTHTGILGTYKVNDMVTVQAGVADWFQCEWRTCHQWPFGNGIQKAYMGAIAFTAPDSWGWAKRRDA